MTKTRHETKNLQKGKNILETDYKEIFEKLEELERFLHRERRRHGHGPGSEGKHAGGQARVLAMLKIQAEMTAKDLSYLLGIRQQSLNELLKNWKAVNILNGSPQIRTAG